MKIQQIEEHYLEKLVESIPGQSNIISFFLLARCVHLTLSTGYTNKYTYKIKVRYKLQKCRSGK